MPRIEWNETGTRYFETGIERGVLYTDLGYGVPWNGLVAVTESPSGGDAQPYYFDGIKYANHNAPEEFEGTIEAFTYPEEFEVCDGTATTSSGFLATQQKRQAFGLSYRTSLGNEIEGISHGYKLHVVYNVKAQPSEITYATASDSSEASTFSWIFTTTPVRTENLGLRPTAHVVLDSRKLSKDVMQYIEGILYGTENNLATLPQISELAAIIATGGEFTLTDHDDGTWTVTGPSEQIIVQPDGSFTLISEDITVIDEDTYTITTVTN